MVHAVRVWERYRAGVLGDTVPEPLKMSLLLPDQAMGPGKSQGLSLSPTLSQVKVGASPDTVHRYLTCLP